MQIEHVMAFTTESEPPALEIRINFGLFAGRGATPAEIDELARLLVPEVGEVSIIAEERHEIADESEVSVHQVRIEVAHDRLPETEPELAALRERLVTLSEIWARACIADRSADVAEL